ncbi:glycosyltransferase family 2 protein [Parvibaculum sp.]|mgnify:CR=1 FL=1|jgi:cellulose synthase/poly-beta-1,6-N-acetylglucosamine synthase-like glycosyltransferase|uniref:glycosyltransferase family 2 protein n=1 Tax=Parvibaculum sp. TaxID=2024848 RepID=UPI002FD88A9F
MTLQEFQPLLSDAAFVVAWVVVGSGLAQTLVYLFQLVVAGYALSRRPPVARSALLWHRYGEVAPPIALIVPAYNEQLNIVESVHSMLSLEYPNFEVIIVNDGSKDETLRRLIEAFELVPVNRPWEDSLPHAPLRGLYASPSTDRLLVVDKENGGKADAQNLGINVSRAPIFCVIDGDSILEPDALIRAAQPFIDDPERTVAVGGTIRIANNSVVSGGRIEEVRLPTQILPLFQVVEYLRAFLMARLAWSRINTLMLVSGAFGVFRRREVIAVGGFTKGSMGEDLDLIIKLHRHLITVRQPYRIQFIPEPVCWTEAPSTLAVLGRQRSRWQRGALEVFFRYGHMFLNPRYGRVGIFGYGHMFIVDVMGPIMEVLGYILMPLFWALGVLDLDFLLAFTALVFTYGIFVSVGSLVLAEAELKRFPRARDLLVLFAAAVLENFGYRQLNNLWRVKGYWQYLRSDNSWGEMTRTGFRSTPG